MCACVLLCVGGVCVVGAGVCMCVPARVCVRVRAFVRAYIPTCVCAYLRPCERACVKVYPEQFISDRLCPNVTHLGFPWSLLCTCANHFVFLIWKYMETLTGVGTSVGNSAHK